VSCNLGARAVQFAGELHDAEVSLGEQIVWREGTDEGR
jgi:hypothetical protein